MGRRKGKKLTPRDRRLRKLYGLSEAEYERILKEQGGGCAICGGPAKTIRLSVEHSHRFRYFKVKTKKEREGWTAWALPVNGIFPLGKGIKLGHWQVKSKAIQAVREMLKRKAVRGIVCFPCNGGLRKFRDNPDFLEQAATYLRKHGYWKERSA